MAEQIRDLDNIAEYFDFKIQGHVYRFKHMTLKEVESLSKIEGDDYTKVMKFLSTYIEKQEEDAPDFADIFESFTIPYIKAFMDMIQAEFGI